MRERETGTQDWTFPTNRMSCSARLIYMCATPGYIWCPVRWNMTSLLILTPNQWFTGYVMWREEWKWESDVFFFSFSRLVYLLHSLFSVCICQTRHGKCHAAKPKMSLSKLSGCFQGRRALRDVQLLSGFLPNVILVFVLIHLDASFFIFHPFYSTLPSTCPSILIAFLNSYLSTLFLQESTFEFHLSVWPSFSCLISFFPAPIRGHANFQRQTTLRIQKYPMCSSNMLIFFFQKMVTECFQRQIVLQTFSPPNISRNASVSLCLLRNASLGDMSSFALY